jgi:hypothetical protein
VSDIASLAHELVEIVVKLKIIAAKLEKAAKSRDKPE